MGNKIILLGIDLGTTNSSISVNIDGKIEVIKKPGGVEFTPSVFGFGKSKNKIVGQKAYDQLYKFYSEDNYKNFKAEIKREMGTPGKISFEKVKIKMSPEEISAEILKSLLEDVLKKYADIDTSAAVITVPASFSVLQSEATKRAGNLAGFKHIILLQEPIAAAISYGFDKTKDENWLVYDLGGGTFDVALISRRDGILSVLSHNGDNFLGGKNIDSKIVEKIIVPKILEKYSISNFTKKNKKVLNIFSRLKYFAETAKIELSQYKKTTIEIDEIGKDEKGKKIELSIEIDRKQFEEIIGPLVNRTIKLSLDTLKDAGIKPSGVKRIILVGGPTQIPFIKNQLEKETGIKVDSSIDPLTVVAKGAGIYAMSKVIPDKFIQKNNIKKGTHEVILNYSPLTSDTEESITGIIKGLDKKEDYYIQIQSDSGTFAGSRVKMKEGKFFYNLNVEKNKNNLYWIYVFDGKNKPINLSEDSFVIAQGLSLNGAPIPHSIGVVVASRDLSRNKMVNTCEKIFEKGSILPLKETLEDYKTSRKLKKGEDNSLDIEIVEGESEIPDRNTFLCKVGIKAKDLPHDLPLGTPIELTLEMNESRELSVNAYIPLVDMTSDARSTILDENIEISKMEKELENQRSRVESTLEDCPIEERKKIVDKVQSISQSVENSDSDEDEKRKANKEIKDLKIMLDEVEEEKAIPQLTMEYGELEENVKKIIKEYADQEQKKDFEQQLKNINVDYKKATKTKDKILLIRALEQLHQLRIVTLFSNPNTWVDQLREIVQNGNFINEKEAQYYITKAEQAIKNNNLDELKRCIHQLQLLMPPEEQEKIKLSGIMR